MPGDTETFSMPPIGQQIEAVLGTLTPEQRRLIWLSQGKGYRASEIQSAAPALGLPAIASDQGYKILGGLFELVMQYMEELESSVNVQQKLLPECPPELPGVDISVRYLPMMGVSGDYYDFLPLGKNRVGLVLGDVSGKGMGAAMLMASIRASLRAQIQVNPALVGEALSHLNRTVSRDAPKYSFVTLTYGVLDVNDHTFTYSDAGHPPVLHYKGDTGNVQQLDIGGGVLGMWEEMEYSTDAVSLDPGDALVLYTDGIIEACNASDELYGIDRLCQLVATYGWESAEKLENTILNHVSQFAQNGWEDDVTVMVVKRVE